MSNLVVGLVSCLKLIIRDVSELLEFLNQTLGIWFGNQLYVKKKNRNKHRVIGFEI